MRSIKSLPKRPCISLWIGISLANPGLLLLLGQNMDLELAGGFDLFQRLVLSLAAVSLKKSVDSFTARCKSAAHVRRQADPKTSCW